MSNTDYFAIFVLVLIAISAIFVFVLLATMPGNVANERGHPQAEAIKVAGWLGLICGGLLWPIVIIWAFTKPRTAAADDQSLNAKISDLESQVQKLQAQIAQSEVRSS